jgi:hypothetical protein
MFSYWTGRSIGYWAADCLFAAILMTIVGAVGFWLGTAASMLLLAGLSAAAYMRLARFAADGGQTGRVLSAERLVIINQNGRPRVALDGTGLQLLDEKGCARILMAVDGDGPAVQVCDESGKLRLSLGSSAAEGSYGLSMIDQQGKVIARAIMRNELHGIASFGLYDASGQIRANLSTSGSTQANLTFTDEDGRFIWRASDTFLVTRKRDSEV